MHGPLILARFLSVPGPPNSYGDKWQYNSRSDRHSKVGCWGVAFDLLSTSALLREHASVGKVILGVNHTMQDFQTHRKKALDLVVARPVSAGTPIVPKKSFKSLVEEYGIPLNEEQAKILAGLPDIPIGEVGAVLIALEAKAAMTAHVKALPRLYDELNSSHLCVHGASEQALAIAYVQINSAEYFASSDRNKFSLSTHSPVITKHNQPHDVIRCLKKIEELPRRTGPSGIGFDGIGATVLDFENTGGPVNVLHSPPAPQSGDPFRYEGMITRMGNEYDSRFRSI